MVRLLVLLTLFVSLEVEAKLIDKVVCIFNSKVVTLSTINRMQTNMPARKNVSPQVYIKDKYSNEDLAQLIINNLIVRDRLNLIGYSVTDEQVEDQIKSTEKRLGLGRKELMNFLQNNNLSFDEYFELIRETIEYNIFYGRVISPLITITEQQIKNTFFNKYLGNKTVSFRYQLVDYSIKINAEKPLEQAKFKEAVSKLHSNSIISDTYKEITTAELDNVAEDGLNNDLVKVLKQTDEGALSSVVNFNGGHHVFYVKKKDIVESELFLNSKEKIRQELFDLTAKNMMDTWFKRESSKHYIKINF